MLHQPSSFIKFAIQQYYRLENTYTRFGVFRVRRSWRQPGEKAPVLMEGHVLINCWSHLFSTAVIITINSITLFLSREREESFTVCWCNSLQKWSLLPPSVVLMLSVWHFSYYSHISLCSCVVLSLLLCSSLCIKKEMSPLHLAAQKHLPFLPLSTNLL